MRIKIDKSRTDDSKNLGNRWSSAVFNFVKGTTVFFAYTHMSPWSSCHVTCLSLPPSYVNLPSPYPHTHDHLAELAEGMELHVRSFLRSGKGGGGGRAEKQDLEVVFYEKTVLSQQKRDRKVSFGPRVPSALAIKRNLSPLHATGYRIHSKKLFSTGGGLGGRKGCGENRHFPLLFHVTGDMIKRGRKRFYDYAIVKYSKPLKINPHEFSGFFSANRKNFPPLYLSCIQKGVIFLLPWGFSSSFFS